MRCWVQLPSLNLTVCASPCVERAAPACFPNRRFRQNPATDEEVCDSYRFLANDVDITSMPTTYQQGDVRHAIYSKQTMRS